MTATTIPLFDGFDDSTEAEPPGRKRSGRTTGRPNDAAKAEPDQLLTVRQAAALLGIGRSKLYELIARGAIASVKVDRCRRFRRSDVDRFIGNLSVAPPS